ncbi:hypothetical protein C2W64_03101 [Brevibacillus laterosporus]|nr:hypothetical protein C2W64_03101 [Brevibacillus laterosporus]
MVLEGIGKGGIKTCTEPTLDRMVVFCKKTSLNEFSSK